ncbi:MAG: MFS transporter [Anaerolineales bacterium]|nr:MFS transporter [Anaerolineales bacterium]
MPGFFEKTREYPRQFWLLFWGMLLSTIGSSMIWPFLMVYASERLNLPLTQTASLVTLNSTASLIMTFAAGQITDRVGRKLVMVVSLLSNAVVYLFFSHAATYSQFAIVMVLLGACNPLYRVGADAMMADIIGPEKRADAYSILRMSNNAGIAIGPAVGGFLAAASPYLAFYIASTGLFLFGLLILLFARETLPEREAGQKVKRERWGGYDRVLRDWPFITTVTNITFGLITASLMWVLLPVYATKVIGIPKQLYGFIPTTNALMVVFLQVLVTQWTKKHPPLRMIALGMFFYAIGVGSVVLGTGFWSFWTSMVIITIGELIIVPTSSTYVANLAPADMRGRYMSIYGLTWSLSIGIGPLLGGFLSDSFGPPATWIGGLVIGLLSTITFFIIERTFHKKEFASETAI